MIKKIFCLLLLCSCFILNANIRWHSDEDIKSMKEKIGIDNYIQAWADCDTKEEAEKITKIFDLDYYFRGYSTMNQTSPDDCYTVLFITDNGRTVIYVYHYTKDSPVVEIYFK